MPAAIVWPPMMLLSTDAVLVAHPQLAPAAAQEHPALVGVERAVGVGLELDRATVLEPGLLALAAGQDVDLGVVAEVEAAREAVVEVQVVLLATARLEAQRSR